MSHPLDMTLDEMIDSCESARLLCLERRNSRGPVALAPAPAAVATRTTTLRPSTGNGKVTIGSVVPIECALGVLMETANAVDAAMVAMPPVIKDYLAEIGGRIILNPVTCFENAGRNAIGLCSRAPGNDHYGLLTIAGKLPENEVVSTVCHEVGHAADLSGFPPLSDGPHWQAIWNDAKTYHRLDERFQCDTLAGEYFSECFATKMMCRLGLGTQDYNTMTSEAMNYMERLFRAWGAEQPKAWWEK
jgi:hypothetical protein